METQNRMRLMPAWFVYETVIPLAIADGWSRVEHQPGIKSGMRETRFIGTGDPHRSTHFQLGAFARDGFWFVKVDVSNPDPTFAVVESESGKTFIVTPRPQRGLGRPLTFSLPTDDTYTYPGEYVTNC